ncbi:TetR family transcriptional regulator [Acidovorax lacteus]|uniref:Efflux system transcriptional repressor NalD n=1 Tax=Acidovorax lacteus TaxID=1924988 RepID=A0ABP8LFF4_9BURK
MVRRTKEDANATRHSLLDAAETVFHERGVSRASLHEIALAAGATRGAIYWHFKDKSDLFNAMMDRVTLPLEQACGEFDNCAGLDPVQRLRGVMHVLLEQVATDAHTRRVFEIALFRVEYVSELVGVRDRHITASLAFTEAIARDFALAEQALGRPLPLPADAAATALHALFDGLIRNWLLTEGGFDLRAVGQGACDTFLRGLGLQWTDVPCPRGVG